MQHCFADNMVDRKLYVIVIVIAGIPKIVPDNTTRISYFLTIFLTWDEFGANSIDDDNMSKSQHYLGKYFRFRVDEFRCNSEIIMALVSFSTDQVRPHLFVQSAAVVSPAIRVWSHHTDCNWQ